MKFDIPIYYDISKQEEVVVKANIPPSKVRQIIKDFFDRKGYDSRSAWLKENLDETDLTTL